MLASPAWRERIHQATQSAHLGSRDGPKVGKNMWLGNGPFIVWYIYKYYTYEKWWLKVSLLKNGDLMDFHSDVPY